MKVKFDILGGAELDWKPVELNILGVLVTGIEFPKSTKKKDLKRFTLKKYGKDSRTNTGTNHSI